MGKIRKKKGLRWDHPDYKKGVYCFERDGYIHTYIFGERMSIRNLPWDKKNKDFAIQVLDKRLKEYYDRQNGFNNERLDTFSELFLFYKEVRFPKIKKQSRIAIVSSIKQIMKDNDLRLSDNVGMTKYFSKRVNQMIETDEYANSTTRNSLINIKSVFEFGIEQEIIKSNPIKSWLIPTKEGFKYVICTRKQLNKVLDTLVEYINSTKFKSKKIPRLKLYYALKIASITGMRINEIATLKPEYVRENKILIFGKGDNWREFPYSVMNGLKELMFEILSFHKEHLSSEEYLLGYLDSRNINSHFYFFMRRKNLVDCKEVKFHAIRKLVENEMMNDYSLNDNIVRSLIGHTIQTQNSHYIKKLSAEEIEDVISTNNLKSGN